MTLGVSLLSLASCQELQDLDERVSKNARAKACEFFDIHLSSERPIDLGNGVVGQSKGGRSPIPYYAGWVATDCKTGRELEVAVDERSEYLAQVTSTEDVTLTELKELAIKRDMATRSVTSDREACGCAAFYPDLVGDKVPAYQRDDMPAWSEL